ncbi:MULTISPECIES: ATP-binding protein [unclassified Streptomyces]|uniref:ATP-binding protein n=1 Tax=unclassified Streptomyces TaxID=2593676 RepID=UPI0019D09550|nr:MULTISPECIES: ATP-binding protein [unclassified Streptomyces]
MSATARVTDRVTDTDEPPVRRLYRSADGRWLGGVARGLAGHLGLPVAWVRAVFAVLVLTEGLGLLLYAVFWIVVPLGVGGKAESRPLFELSEDGRRRLRKPDRGQIVALVALAIGASVLIANLRIDGETGRYVWPTLLIGVGVVLVWRQADNARAEVWTGRGATRRRRGFHLVRGLVGVALVGTGLAVFVVVRGSIAQIGTALTASVAVLTGIALLAGPWLIRMSQDLTAERTLRIRAQERAEVAAHVHDSVLHTLTLIQRNADDAGEVRRLARAQERELRNWLYKPEGTGKDEEPETLAEAVKRAAAEVEDKHGVPLEVVVVGDCPLDEKLAAQMQAAREAMVNAAKYGGEGGAVQVYAEVEGRTVFVSVRDRGPGFDLDQVPEDRMGVRESIIGRMQRNGGTARLRAVPGGGTEVELEMERADG